MTPAPAALPAAVWEGRTNAARKAIRTTLQVIVALVPMALLAVAGVLDPAQALGLSAALTPVVTFAQNLLEDKGLLGTWLRRPTPTDTASVVVEVPEAPEGFTYTQAVAFPVEQAAPYDQDEDEDPAEPRFRLVRRPPPA